MTDDTSKTLYTQFVPVTGTYSEPDYLDITPPYNASFTKTYGDITITRHLYSGAKDFVYEVAINPEADRSVLELTLAAMIREWEKKHQQSTSTVPSAIA